MQVPLNFVASPIPIIYIHYNNKIITITMTRTMMMMMMKKNNNNVYCCYLCMIIGWSV